MATSKTPMKPHHAKSFIRLERSNKGLPLVDFDLPLDSILPMAVLQEVCLPPADGVFIDLAWVVSPPPEENPYLLRLAGLPVPEEPSDDEDPVTVDEDTLLLEVVPTEGFQDLCSRLRKCKNVRDLVLNWRLSTSYILIDQPVSETGKPHAVFDRLIEAVEAMPSLKRYCVVADRYAMYARRAEGRDWAHASTVRLTWKDMKKPEGEWAKLLEDLHVE